MRSARTVRGEGDHVANLATARDHAGATVAKSQHDPAALAAVEAFRTGAPGLLNQSGRGGAEQLSGAVNSLQQSCGNRSVQRLLNGCASATRSASENVIPATGPSTVTDLARDAAEEEEMTTDASVSAEAGVSGFSGMSGSAAPPAPVAVRTVLCPGRSVETTTGGWLPPESDRAAHATVSPGGAPTTGTADNTCTPSTASAALSWNVVSIDDANWGVDVASLTLAGRVNVRPWASNPTTMTVPNTANPVDGGNINNTAGSSNHWQAAIDDMSDYDSAGGCAGPNWHSTTASNDHEWAHWNQDYVTDSVTSSAGGNWPQVNRGMDALREPKANSASQSDARTALQPRVDSLMGGWRSGTVSRWNTLISTTDNPGSGGRGYAAGMAVLTGLISAVRAYATAKRWTGGGGGSGGTP